MSRGLGRRDAVRLVAIGAGAALVPGAAVACGAPREGDRIMAAAHTHAEVSAGGGGLALDVAADELRDAALARREVDAAAYLAAFQLRPAWIGVGAARVTIVTTRLPGPLAELIESDGRVIAVWDGVAYEVVIA